MAEALDKARTREAVAKALLTVARSDYERARAARVGLEAECEIEPLTCPRSVAQLLKQ